MEVTEFVKKLGQLVNVEGAVDKRSINLESASSMCLDRSPVVLFMTSTQHGDFLLQYHLNRGTWLKSIALPRKSPSPEFLKSMIATCLPSGDIALTGGVEPQTNKGIKKCKILSRSTLNITPITPLNTGRYSHCALELFGQLYVIGGYDGTKKLTECERFRYIETEVQTTNPIPWIKIGSLNVPRSNLCGCVFNKRTFYIFGGEQPPTLERYNVLLNTWELIPPIRDFDPLLTMSAIGLHRVDDTDELVLFGSYYTFFYDTKTGVACNKSEYISQMIERSLKYDGKIVSFTKDQPLYCISFQAKPFTVFSKNSSFRHLNDIELRTFPAAITRCHE